jgi:hypothetical protein
MRKVPKMDKVSKFKRGDMVTATRDIDPEHAQVMRGMVGVVYEVANAYGDGYGPMVKWINGGACNVYDHNVRLITHKPERQPCTLIQLFPSDIKSERISHNPRVIYSIEQ